MPHPITQLSDAQLLALATDPRTLDRLLADVLAHEHDGDVADDACGDVYLSEANRKH